MPSHACVLQALGRALPARQRPPVLRMVTFQSVTTSAAAGLAEMKAVHMAKAKTLARRFMTQHSFRKVFGVTGQITSRGGLRVMTKLW